MPGIEVKNIYIHNQPAYSEKHNYYATLERNIFIGIDIFRNFYTVNKYSRNHITSSRWKWLYTELVRICTEFRKES